jgi:hypothetical protein
MSNGSDAAAGDKTYESIIRNISHNLEIAEKCFRCLISMLGGDGSEEPVKRRFIVGDVSDFEKILDLCVANAQLIENVHDLLLDGAGMQPANGENFVPQPETGNHEGVSDDGDYDLDRKFRESLVDLMILSVQCWEQCTQKSRIELAEESNVWRISVDGGRLRVRSMDRYLCVTKLPKVPRWRDVLKTAYFVLDNAGPDSPVRKRLEESLDRMLWILRKRSLR